VSAALADTGAASADLNRIHLTGTLGSEPLLTSVGDHPLATLTLVSERWWRTPAGKRKRDSSWFTLSAWEELAEQCGRLLHRGDRVYVEGSLQLWPDWRSGRSSTSYTIVLDRIVLLAVRHTNAAVSHQ
jgi:single stranded DNA-binding protein